MELSADLETVTLPGRRVEDEIAQPGGRAGVAMNVEVCVRDHIHQEQGVDAAEFPVGGQLPDQMAAAIKAVAGRPTAERFPRYGDERRTGRPAYWTARRLAGRRERTPGAIP